MNKHLLILLACILAPELYATTLLVPAQYPSIQSAINAASSGDTILVSPGIYYENINFRGKGITVASLFLTSNDTSFIDATVINGSQPVNADTASCVIIRGNDLTSSTDTSALLAGFRITGGTGTRWEDEHNAGSWYREGGGILIQYSSPRIRFCHICFNKATNKLNCVSAGGGAIRCGDGNPLITNNIIDHNEGRYGGGLVFNFSGGVLKNNVISNNSGGQDYGGGGIWAYGLDGLSRQKIIENNTIVNNSSTGAGGGIRSWNTTMNVTNSILWGNSATSGAQIQSSGTLPVVTWCDVQGGFAGNNNVDTDPVFETDNFYLAGLSPCIDGGDTAFIYNDRENPLTPGLALFPAKETIRNDMGAYGGKGSALMANVATIATGVKDHVSGHSLKVTLDPVPCNEILHINLDQEKTGKVKIVLLNSQGKRMRTIIDTALVQGKQTLNAVVKDLSSGMYFLRFESEGNSLTKSFVVKKAAN